MSTLKEKLQGFLEPKLIEEIASIGNIMNFKEGDVIMDYGKKIKFMPLILSGTIRVMRKDEEDREILLYYLGSNETLCRLSALSGSIKDLYFHQLEK
ncbi:MAG: hypothetical protein RLZZ69_2594 [Cyanobacteriota bacterium]